MSNWLANGGTRAALYDLMRATPEWAPDSAGYSAEVTSSWEGFELPAHHLEFNGSHDIEDLLRAAGFTAGTMSSGGWKSWRHPSSGHDTAAKSRENKVAIWSASAGADLGIPEDRRIKDGKAQPFDAFELFAYTKHGGDLGAAKRAATRNDQATDKGGRDSRRKNDAEKVYEVIKKASGVFIKDEEGYSILINKRRILINAELHNVELAKLFDRAGVSENFTAEGKRTVQRLLVRASEQANNMHVRKFSAMSTIEPIYIPTTQEVLEISAGDLRPVPNGSNADRVWIEHPYGDPLKFNSAVNVKAALKRFEELIVDTATCAVPAMKLLLAMNAALFPFIRDGVTARMLTLLTGPSQNGKTTAARRYHLLHHGRQPGINEDVLGDYSVASLGNLGDTGFLVMDNKETADMRRDFINFLLYLATGAERGRSTSDGSIRPRLPGRPVGVVTSIEGFSRNELQLRTAIIKFERHGKPIDNYPIEQAILSERHDIISALVEVLRRYLQLGPTGQEPPKDSTFTGHWEALCRSLCICRCDGTGPGMVRFHHHGMARTV